MIFTQSKNRSIINITGQLHFEPHEIRFGGFCPIVGLNIFIFKKPYYYLGFGKQIKKHSHIQIRTRNHGVSIKGKTVYAKWYKKRTYYIDITIFNNWLFNKLLGDKNG